MQKVVSEIPCALLGHTACETEPHTVLETSPPLFKSLAQWVFASLPWSTVPSTPFAEPCQALPWFKQDQAALLLLIFSLFHLHIYPLFKSSNKEWLEVKILRSISTNLVMNRSWLEARAEALALFSLLEPSKQHVCWKTNNFYKFSVFMTRPTLASIRW